MAHSYKPRRNKLKSHDSGEDRHNKGVAFNNKAIRKDLEHQRTVSGMGHKKAWRKNRAAMTRQTVKLLKTQNEEHNSKLLALQEKWGLREAFLRERARRKRLTVSTKSPERVAWNGEFAGQQLRPAHGIGADAMRRWTQ